MSSKAPTLAKTAAAASATAAPAHGAAAHWGLERAVSLAAFALLVWLAVSLVRLPSLDHQMVSQWLKAPLAAVPTALLIVTLFWHLKLGLAQIVEDYVEDEGGRLIWLGLIHYTAILVGAFALFAAMSIAFTGQG